jgi:hypothetical protein
VLGLNLGSRGEVPGKRTTVIGHNNNNNNNNTKFTKISGNKVYKNIQKQYQDNTQ